MAICRPVAVRYSHRIESSCAETILPAGCHQQSYMKPWRGGRGCNCRPLSVIRACGTARRWTASFTDPAGTTELCWHYHIRCLILGLSPAMPIPADLRVRKEKEVSPVANLLLHRIPGIEWNSKEMLITKRNDSVLCLQRHLFLPSSPFMPYAECREIISFLHIPLTSSWLL